MRPPELETKLETGAFGPDVLFTRYGDSPANAVCIAPRTMPTAPGDALKIVKRLGLYPDLVEACERTEREIRLTREALAIGRTGANAIGLGMAYDAVVAILARCKEVPK